MLEIKEEYAEYTNKTFRLPNKIIDILDEQAKNKNTFLNKVVIQCLEYAIDNLKNK